MNKTLHQTVHQDLSLRSRPILHHPPWRANHAGGDLLLPRDLGASYTATVFISGHFKTDHDRQAATLAGREEQFHGLADQGVGANGPHVASIT